eukprot:CAMPEP_0198111842 /NCGR_PEP_ID=MMETSP1442-20131203/3767_1 /TAXON_ID= /ORGANISM="Craspedostauros australis, Strain CCMP3328" /LENGTH=112 /DNA_ID=CAMNT_0043768437 /DNA_START=125 /DNA_END=463 /DNA_ORIENTATION=+
MVLATSVRKEASSQQARGNGTMDLASCQNILASLKDVGELPMQCKNYPSVLKQVKQKEDEKAMAIAFAGMRPGMAVEARRSRTTGYESHSKLKRRLTSSGAHHHTHPQKTGN